MVQGQTKIICSTPIYASAKDYKDNDMKKPSSWTSKDQTSKIPVKSYASANAKQDPWGKVFKNEQHFKSMHICWNARSFMKLGNLILIWK